MDNWGIHTGSLVIQLFNLALLCSWPIISLVTLLALKSKKLTGTNQAIWVLIRDRHPVPWFTRLLDDQTHRGIRIIS